jgi:hypothetical protein
MLKTLMMVMRLGCIFQLWLGVSEIKVGMEAFILVFKHQQPTTHLKDTTV